ncbi:MAG: S1 RNA-binding domain-containing protein [Candidatus Melainabacteria bacterium]|nr:S1 RNA-binding domain-containing protein [Candidatus Melainabacteria bacterium]MBI3309404.1 S1 RNA-binding domain-containing protein [Candidatus Melainabacteria bacterium]
MTALTYDELKNKCQNKPEKDSQVSCKVLAKFKDGYLIDINDEWEGFIPKNHMLLTNDTEQDPYMPFSALIISGPDKSGRYMVSPKALKEKAVWQELLKLYEDNTLIKVKIAKAIKGGAEVYIDSVRAFIPGRYLRLPGLSPESWTNREVDVLIEEINYDEKKIILNQRKAWDLQRQREASITIQKVQEGDILDVPVLRVADFGVFVDLGGLDGLIPASELSWGRFNHPRDIVKVGQTLKARVFRIEKENQRVALSVKQLLGDPWEDIDREWNIGSMLNGKVIGEANFGLFIELKPGVEALLHNTEIPEGMQKPKIGSEVKVKILKIDIDQRKIGVTLNKEESVAVKEESTCNIGSDTQSENVTNEETPNLVAETDEVIKNGNMDSVSHGELN